MKTKYYYIHDKEDLNQLRSLEENQNAVVVFYSNIEFKDGEEFEPIDARSNSIEIEGYNHRIINLNINKPNDNFVGLFSYVKKLIVKNLSFKDANITGLEVCGTVAGEVSENLVVSNVKLSTTVNSDAIGGGIAGIANDISIKNSKINANVSGRGMLGGISGSANSLQKDNKTTIEVTLNDSYRDIVKNTATSDTVGYLGTNEEKQLLIMIAKDISKLPVDIDENEMKQLLVMCKKENN